jgi:Spy/CpxP family protein refolding chaperone
MKRLWLVLSLAVAPGVRAQQPAPLPTPPDTAEAGRLRAQIEERFAQHVQQELRLTADQAAKLRASQERFGTRRRALLRQQVERRMALQDQMQPGVAANADSVKKLMDGMQAGRAEMLKIDQDEDREMAGYLTPVQRARYQEMRERFHRRVNEMRAERRGQVGRAGPGARAGRGGVRPPQRPGRRPI